MVDSSPTRWQRLLDSGALGLIALGLVALIGLGVWLFGYALKDSEEASAPELPAAREAPDESTVSASPATTTEQTLSTTSSPAQATTTNLEDVDVVYDPTSLGRLGDCFNETDALTAVDCSEPHDYQLVLSNGVFDSADGSELPTEDQWRQWETEVCTPALEEFVGPGADLSELRVIAFGPTREDWEQGERATWCAAYDPTGPLVDSLEDR